MSGICKCKHRLNGSFPTALLCRQPTFINSDTSVLRIISFGHHQAVVYIWEFEASLGGLMPFLMPTRYGLWKRGWELKTFSAEVEFQPSYFPYSILSINFKFYTCIHQRQDLPYSSSSDGEAVWDDGTTSWDTRYVPASQQQHIIISFI